MENVRIVPHRILKDAFGYFYYMEKNGKKTRYYINYGERSPAKIKQKKRLARYQRIRTSRVAGLNRQQPDQQSKVQEQILIEILNNLRDKYKMEVQKNVDLLIDNRKDVLRKYNKYRGVNEEQEKVYEQKLKAIDDQLATYGDMTKKLEQQHNKLDFNKPEERKAAVDISKGTQSLPTAQLQIVSETEQYVPKNKMVPGGIRDIVKQKKQQQSQEHKSIFDENLEQRGGPQQKQDTDQSFVTQVGDSEKEDKINFTTKQINKIKNINKSLIDRGDDFILREFRDALEMAYDKDSIEGVIEEYQLIIDQTEEEEGGGVQGTHVNDMSKRDGLSVIEVLRMFTSLIPNISEYDINVITEDSQIIQSKKPNIIVIFLKSHHYTIGIFREDRDEFVYFDPLAMKERRERDFKQIRYFGINKSDIFMMKYKFNKNAWEDTQFMDKIYGKQEQAWCGFFIFLFAHNYITLNEPFEIASEWQSADKTEMDKINPQLINFPYI